jgi:DHA3 family macrolide efflux protein-like MFS transporter
VVVIWLGQAFSIITSYSAGYASIWYFTETTNSAFMLSVATIVSILPTGLLSPLGGLLADRFNRRTIMLVSDAIVGLASLVLGIIIYSGYISLALLLVMVFIRAVAQAFHTPALTAAMPLMVPQRHLVRINSLSQMLWGFAGIGAPVLGIFLYNAIGFYSVMFLDVLGAALACGGLLLVRIPTVHDENMENQRFLHNLLDGWRVIYHNRGLFLFMLMSTLAMLLFMPIGAMFPLMTYQHFGPQFNNDPVTLGYMASLVEAVWGICMLVGSLALMAWGGGKRHVRLVLITGVIISLTIAGCGLLRPGQFVGFAVLTGIMAIVVAFYNGPMITVIQNNSPEEKMGRVMGLFGSLMSLTSPVGLVIAGLIAEQTGVALWFLISGVIMAVLAVLMFFIKPIRDLDFVARGADEGTSAL